MATIRKNGGKWINQKDRLAIYVRDNFSCAYCNEIVDDLTLDHITPDSLGGSDKHNNLITCCRSCNSKKGKKDIRSFSTVDQYDFIFQQITLEIEPFLNAAKYLIKIYGNYSSVKSTMIKKLNGEK